MINKRNLQLNTFSTDPLTYRGNADSSEMNYILNTLKTNANNCILRTRKTSKKLDDLRKAYVYLNQYLNDKVNDLDYRTDKLITYAASGLHSSTISFYDANIASSGVLNGTNVNTNYGQLTLNEDNKWSKINRYIDYMGDKRPTPDVKIIVDDTTRNPGDDSYNCLDSLNYTLWIETMTYADHVIKFQLPKSIKPKINSMKIDFFPQYCCMIKKIEYYSIKGLWETLNNYDSDGRSIMMHFSPYDYADQVRITVSPVSTSEPIIGIGNFDLYLTNYTNIGTATFKFPETEKYIIKSLDNINIDYYIDNYSIINQFSTSNPLKIYLIIDTDEYEVSFDVINGTNKLNLNTGTITNKNISIRYELQETNLTSPVIRGSSLSFSI